MVPVVLRNLLNVCVLVMLLVQGVAQASAHVQPHSSSTHCASHDAAKTDCPCCGDSWLEMAAGCASGCAALVAIPQLAFDLPRTPPQLHLATALQWQAGPNYLPLTPPPIS
jgi:hypothetical protein